MEFDFIAAKGMSGGLVFIWERAAFQVSQSIKDQNYLQLIGRVPGCDNDVMVLNVYTPQDRGFQQGQIGVRKMELKLQRFNDFISQADLLKYNMGGAKFVYMPPNDNLRENRQNFCVCKF